MVGYLIVNVGNKFNLSKLTGIMFRRLAGEKKGLSIDRKL